MYFNASPNKWYYNSPCVAEWMLFDSMWFMSLLVDNHLSCDEVQCHDLLCLLPYRFGLSKTRFCQSLYLTSFHYLHIFIPNKFSLSTFCNLLPSYVTLLSNRIPFGQVVIIIALDLSCFTPMLLSIHRCFMLTRSRLSFSLSSTTVFTLVWTDKSSAYMSVLDIIFRGKSFINVMTNKGARMLPCGTPCVNGIVDDVADLNWTHWFLPCR